MEWYTTKSSLSPVTHAVQPSARMKVERNGNSSSRTAPANASQFVFPTTFAQQRLWFLEQLQPGGTSYLVPWSLRIEGSLNIPALEKSLDEIIQRHEILRTTFSWKDGMLMQVVGDSRFSLPVLNLSGLKNPQERAEELCRAEARLPLDLERGPLIRAQLLVLSPQLHVLLLTMHHIIFDGWSRRILVRELAALYEAFGAGKPSPLPELKLQYPDYAVWQRKQFQGPKLEKDLSYWRQQLAGAPASLDLLTNHPRPAMQRFGGAKAPFSFPKEFNENLQTFSRERGVTAFMTLLAGFQILLSRYSNQDDVVVGTPIANRNRAEIEEMIGFFTNTLVLRTQLSGEATFAEVLAQVKEMALGAYAHQDLPFEKLVEELQPERNLGQNPLFQVMFSYQNTPRRAFELGGLSVSLVDVGETASKFDLSLLLSETPEGVGGRVEYNTDLFEAKTVEGLLRHYKVLLENAITQPTTKVAKLPILTEAERQQVLVEFNANEHEFPSGMGLHHLLEQAAQRTPEATAVVCGRKRTTYRELNSRANQIAHHLMKLGAGPGALIGVFLERNSDLLPAILGVLKSGAAYVPLDPSYPKDRLAAILEDAKASIVLTQQSLAATVSGTADKVICVDSDWGKIAQESNENPGAKFMAENLAYVLFTSGSTGRPKGVALRHNSAVMFVHWTQTVFTPKELAGVLLSTSVCFDLSIFEIFATLSVGGTIILVQNALYLPSAEARNEVTLINTVPSAMAELVRTNAVPASVKTVNLAGEVLPESLVNEIYASTSVEKVYNLYGPTEDTTYSTYTLTKPNRPVTIGKPLPNTQAYVVDRYGNPQPVGIPGELYLAGDGLAQGYYGRPDLTAERFVRNPFGGKSARMYKTGDLCRWLADGNLEYLGRLDHQVKLRGFRIELGEIEAALAKHESVRQCLVMAREDEPGMKRLVAYVVATSGEKADSEPLREHLKQSLPEFMVPSAFVMLESFPLTPNGKVDRKALPKPELSAASVTVAPRDEVETRLQKIWQEILQCGPMGVTDNFFDLGGHSLMAVRLVNEIKKATGIEIPLTELFQGATIEHLAKLIRGTTSVKQVVANQIQAGTDRAPFFAAVLAGINALGYVPLAKHLGPEQPFYTLQRPGPGPQALGHPYTRAEYEEVAGEYVRAMREIQPEGPYFVGGTCEGARIAFEMTRILESEGEQVNLLAIIDTWVLENTQNRWLWKIYYYQDQLRRLGRKPWRERFAVVNKAFGNRLKWWTRSKSAPRKSEWIETYWPGQDFVAAKVQSRITVFKIPRQPFYYRPDALLGWGSRTTSGVDIEVVPHGKHLLLLREPYVRELAVAMAKTLHRIHSDSTQRSALGGETESADAATVTR